MRDATRERLADGGLELGGPIAVQQLQQRGGDGAEIVAALAGALEQGDARRRRPCEPVSATMTARGTFACDEGRKMRGILDLSPLVIAAPMAGEDLGAVDDAHLVGIGQHGERAPNLSVGHRVIVEVKTDIGRLADLDRQALVQRIGMVRQLEQTGRFLGEGLANRRCLLLRARPVRRHAGAPGRGLGVEVVHIDKLASRKEVVANIADSALDPSLLVAACNRHRARFVAIMRGEREQRGMEADSIALALQHRALEIVVEQHPGTALPCREGSGMAAQKALQTCVEEEPYEDLTRVAQHHDERHQRAAGASDAKMAEVSPVHLPLLTWQTAQAQIGLGWSPRAMAGDEVAEVLRPAAITTLAHHAVEATGG